MWKDFVYLAVLIVGLAFGYFVSGGRINFRRGKTIQREQRPGCGALGEDNDGSRGDASLYWCRNGGCRVREYEVFPYNIKGVR